MTTHFRALATVSIMALGLSLAAGTSRAQQIGSVIAFGDSLSDNGNLYAVIGQPASPPYFQGRFSNGPVFTEYLNGPLQQAGAATLAGIPIDPTGNQDYAFGGARTDRLDFIPPGIPSQIDFFQVQDGAFAPSDLVTLYGGANDIFQYFQNTPTAAITSAGIVQNSLVAAGNIGASADRLSQIGAPTLVVLNLPDIGAIPSFNGSPLTSIPATLATTSFNSALQQQVFASAAANPGTNTYLVDVFALADFIRQNPARFGYTNNTDACLFVPTCSFAPQSAQNQFQFFDMVHPTTAGHQLFASLVLDYLNAGQAAADAGALSETAILDRLDGSNAALSRTRKLAVQAATGGTPLTGFYADIGGATFDRNSSGSISGYDYEAGTLRVGYDRFFSESLLVGGAVSATTGSVDNSRFEYDTNSVAADLYGTALFGPTHVSLVAGIAHYDFDDIRRRTLVPTISNFGDNTNAFVANVGAEAGYTFQFGALSVTPTAALTYVHFDVDGFSEVGVGARIAYGDYQRDALYGAVGVDFGYDTSILGAATRLNGRLAYEDSLTDGGDSIVSTIVNSPNRPVRADFADLAGRGFIVGAGAEVALTETIAASLDYSIGFSSDIDVSQSGRIGLSFKF